MRLVSMILYVRVFKLLLPEYFPKMMLWIKYDVMFVLKSFARFYYDCVFNIVQCNREIQACVGSLQRILLWIRI